MTCGCEGLSEGRIIAPIGHGHGDDGDDERDHPNKGRRTAEGGLCVTRWALSRVLHVFGASHFSERVHKQGPNLC